MWSCVLTFIPEKLDVNFCVSSNFTFSLPEPRSETRGKQFHTLPDNSGSRDASRGASITIT